MDSKGFQVDPRATDPSRGTRKNREKMYLAVTIAKVFLKDKSYHFLIQLQKKLTQNDGGGPAAGGANDSVIDQSEVSRNFNQFHQLYNELRAEGYVNLPRLPDKTLLQVTSEDGLEKRRQELESLLQQLIRNKEHMNAREVVSFLGLHEFCPELLVCYPQLLFEHREKPHHAVSHCIFIPRHNLFITISNCKKQNRCIIKMFNFKTSTAVEDSYLLKTKRETKQLRAQ